MTAPARPGRDRKLTGPKLARVEGAIEELLACSDLEMRPHFERALRAAAVNRQWLADEGKLELVEDEEPAQLALEPAPDTSWVQTADIKDAVTPEAP